MVLGDDLGSHGALDVELVIQDDRGKHGDPEIERSGSRIGIVRQLPAPETLTERLCRGLPDARGSCGQRDL